MPLFSNVNAYYGAAFVGFVGAALVYIAEHYVQEKKRHAMAKDLARLDSELSVVRKDLERLLKEQKEKQGKKHGKKIRKANSTITTTTDDFMSTVTGESSDSEFFDISDDDIDGVDEDYERRLPEIDTRIESGRELQETLEYLKDLCIQYPENPDLLWRLGRLHYKIFQNITNKDEQREHLRKGIEACEAAIDLRPNDASAYKWLAILVGSRAQLQPIKDKISDGKLFKKYMDVALKLNASDAALHHMLGRYCYELASLKWYERKIAAAMFEEPPMATYEKALDHFLEADKLNNLWKENILYIAKTLAALNRPDEVLEWLTKAKQLDPSRCESDPIVVEIWDMFDKYSTNR